MYVAKLQLADVLLCIQKRLANLQYDRRCLYDTVGVAKLRELNARLCMPGAKCTTKASAVLKPYERHWCDVLVASCKRTGQADSNKKSSISTPDCSLCLYSGCICDHTAVHCTCLMNTLIKNVMDGSMDNMVAQLFMQLSDLSYGMRTATMAKSSLWPS
jgi:hypothetical protein